MEQIVKVCKCNSDGTAQVLCLRQSACSGDYHKCAGCGAVEQKLLFTAQNPIGAKPGETVRVRTRSGPVLLGAAILYILPLVLLLIGYLLAAHLWNLGYLGAMAGLALGLCLAAIYDRLVARKNPPQYTIIGY
ncbi:MAG: SoxR reducing system RseC family protein [Oscillospiraceae bacterium]|nr:SoxR reducing system RseC family protein [Oscillospiraceae bacterium]